MEIREFLAEVGAKYRRLDGTKKGVRAQDLLRAAPDCFTPYVPVGWRVKGNGGQGSGGRTPWVGIYSPNVTLDAHRGLYIVYLFAENLESVTLALIQGVTGLIEDLTRQPALTVLEQEVQRLVGELPELHAPGWGERMDLASPYPDQKAYEKATVSTRRYALPDLPAEPALREDLWHMTRLLERAALNQAERLRQQRTSDRRKAVEGPAVVKDFEAATFLAQAGDSAEWFKPKNASDYVAHVTERTLVKSRDHEALIEEFGTYIRERGFRPVTKKVHPRDLVLIKDADRWLVEAKAVYSGNATQAVREATGQLLTYRHFLYIKPNEPTPHLLALFAECVGDGYVEFLESIGIGSVWRTRPGWAGSKSAAGWGLV